MRIGIDAMGGDKAPEAEVRGALDAREMLAEDDKIVLIGQEKAILDQLAAANDWRNKIEIRHAEQVIGMSESPVEALRSKPNSSIALLAQMQHNKEIDASISAGNTGAFVAAAQMRLRRLRGVHRPGITIVTPTHHGPVAVCDVGANVNSRPQHLHQYALMASVYIGALCGVKNPRVGLLSVGEEEGKGNELVRRARELLRDDTNVNFIGNVEGRDLFAGVCDVLVCDGFVGNVVLKLIEGMAQSVIKGIISELAENMPSATDELRKATDPLFNKYDFNEYGGAPLLGVAGICIICHGASDHRGIKNAVRVAKELIKHHVNEKITELLRQNSRKGNA